MARVWPALVIGSLLAAAPVAAQQSGPIRLAPLPPVSGETGPGTSDGSARDPQPGDIRVRGLESVGEDSVGVIGDEGGGLGRDMWAGSQRTDAIRLVGAMPDAYPFRAAYDLAVKFLSTAASAPASVREGQSLLAPRVDRLAAMGAGDRAVALARAVQGRSVPDHLAAPLVRGHFARADIASACQVADGYGGGYADAFWQQVLIVCQVAAGNADQVGLGLDLLRDQGVAVDPVFVETALAAGSGGKVALKREEGASPDMLTLALLVAAGGEMPEWLADDVRPGLLPLLMSAPGAGANVKLRATHEALRRGVVDDAQAAEIYLSLGADDAAIAAALTAPDTIGPDLLLAYLYLAAERRREPIARSEALSQAWREARNIDAFDVIALSTASLLADVPATPDFGWLAADAAEVALIAGDTARALDWYRLVRRQAPVIPELATAGVVLWPAMRTIGRASQQGFSLNEGTTAVASLPPASRGSRGPIPWSAARLERWIELTSAVDPAPDHAEVLVMLASLGDAVDDAQWRRVPPGAPGEYTMPDAAAWAGLGRASAAGRKAETAAYALHVLGRAGDDPHPAVVGAAIMGLVEVGLHDAARSLAREVVAQQISPPAAP